MTSHIPFFDAYSLPCVSYFSIGQHPFPGQVTVN